MVLVDVGISSPLVNHPHLKKERRYIGEGIMKEKKMFYIVIIIIIIYS